MTTQQDSVDVERLDVATKIKTLRAEMASGKPREWYPVHRDYLAAILNAASLSLPITQRDEQGGGLREALRDIMGHFGWQDRGPGHSHTVKGVWDDDVSNGRIAGTPCDWCAKWENARRLSIEQGDQDGGER